MTSADFDADYWVKQLNAGSGCQQNETPAPMIDAASFDHAASQFISAVDALDCPKELRSALFNFATHLIENGHAIKFNCVLTGDTSETVVLAHPSQRFLGLMVAVGAGE